MSENIDLTKWLEDDELEAHVDLEIKGLDIASAMHKIDLRDKLEELARLRRLVSSLRGEKNGN